MTDGSDRAPSFDPDERRSVLDAWRVAWRARDMDAVSALNERYRALVPRVPVSRSPIDGTVVCHSLDTVDIDGLWWSYDNAIRPIEELPPTWFAMAGAMRLVNEVADTAFLVKPGPEIPFVVPRILAREGLVAVLSQVPVGPHTGYAITYFAPDPVRLDLPRINTWGSNLYVVRRPGQTPGWDTTVDWCPEWDFDLGPWIQRGLLAWIAPGDDTLTLRHDVAGCPYLGLEGHIEPTRIQFGHADHPAPPSPGMWGYRPNG